MSDAREPTAGPVNEGHPASGRRSEPNNTVRARRELIATVVVCGVGAGLVLLAAGQPWVRAVVDLPPPLPTGRQALLGRHLAPPAAALGLAGLAGLAGLVATRGIARAVVGVMLASMGAGAAAFSITGVRPGRVLAELSARTSFGGEESATTLTSTPWWVVSLVGGLALIVAGVLTVVRGREWPGMSGRYDRPDAAAPMTAPEPGEPGAMWDSLDRGGDPTADADAKRNGSNGKGR